MTVTETSDAWSNDVWLSVLACVMGYPMYQPQWPRPFVYSDTVHEVLHALSHLWGHVDDRLNRISREIAQMSQSLSDQFAAAVTKVNADIDALTTEVQTLLAGMTPGEPLTQAMVDSVTAIAARLEAIPAIPAAPVPPAPPATA